MSKVNLNELGSSIKVNDSVMLIVLKRMTTPTNYFSLSCCDISHS